MAQTTNIAAILDHSAARWPGATALLHHDAALSFAEVRQHADAIAQDLAAIGVGPGVTVAMLARNSPEFVCSYFGILKTGATLLPINPLMLPGSVAEQMRTCGATRLLVHAALDSSALRAALAGIDVVEISLTGNSATPRFDTVFPGPDAVALRLFTSGTTGAAKAVGLSHYNLLINAMLFREVLDCRAGDRVLACLPLAYGIGQTGLLNGPFIAGAAVVLQPAFHPAEALGLIERHRVTAMIGVPTLYRKLLDVSPGAPASSRFEAHWRIACIGGAPVPAALWADVESALGPKVVIGYGLSETSPLVCSTSPGAPPTPHLIGHPPVGVDVSIRLGSGQPAPVDASGELWVRGHNVGLGYLVADRAQAPAAFDGEWFKTGDVARMDSEGRVFHLGRMNDIIIRSGHNINPAEVEQVLSRHPAVALVAVLGVPDPVTGEEIAACIVPAPGNGDDPELAVQLANWARNELPSHAYPRHVRVLPALPMGPTGKVLKAELRALFTVAE